MIGTVEAGERFEVESVEGFSNYFRSAADFSPERYARGRGREVGRDRADRRRGARAGGAVAVTIHDVEVTPPGVVVYGAYEGEDRRRGGTTSRPVAVYPVEDGAVAFRRAHVAAVRPLIGCLAAMPGGERAPRQAAGALRRQHGLPGARRGRDARAARLARRRRALLRRLQGADGRQRDRRPARGAARSSPPARSRGSAPRRCAGRASRPRRPSPRWSRARRSSGARGRHSASSWSGSSTTTTRAAAGGAADGDGRAGAGICQISNTDYTAYCDVPRDALEPYAPRLAASPRAAPGRRRRPASAR